jgi:hypothetical protein
MLSKKFISGLKLLYRANASVKEFIAKLLIWRHHFNNTGFSGTTDLQMTSLILSVSLATLFNTTTYLSTNTSNMACDYTFD